MWPFNKKYALWQSVDLAGHTDCHCHILPGVDDGIQEMEQSLEALEYFESLGLTGVWLTPHVMEDIPNTTAALKARYQELCEAYKGPLKLNLAAEYMLDSLFSERFDSGDLMPITEDGRHVLVETSYFNPPMGLRGILSDILSSGKFPLLAHPERYLYMKDEDYEWLHEHHVHLQLNLMSLTGCYGSHVQKRAFKLLERGWYHAFGSDLHRLANYRHFLSEKVLDKKVVEQLQQLVDRSFN